MPTAEVDAFPSFTGTDARAQAFKGGVMYVAASGPQSGKVYFVSGLIEAKYLALGGGRGQLGLPTTDEFGVNGRRHQEFEGGILEFAPGDVEAALTPRDRKPSVTATPSAVVAGTRLRLTVGGFANGSTIKVSITGQPDFTVAAASGSYFWDAFVPLSAPTSTITVKAVDTANPTNSASAAYSIKAIADAHTQIIKKQGDAQSAPPGATLPLPLRIVLEDDAGNPLPGFAVKFTASSGAQIVAASAFTDSNGEAQAVLRMPTFETIVLATAEAGRQVATFSARS
jgi:hypothetical protein